MKRSTITWTSLTVLVMGSVALAGSGAAAAYEAAAVTDGAVVRGQITLKGAVPEPKQFELRRYPDRVFCGALSSGDGYRQFKEVNVGANGGLKEAKEFVGILVAVLEVPLKPVRAVSDVPQWAQKASPAW